MPQWKHVQCGTVYQSPAPPIFCEVCLASDNKGLGWQHVPGGRPEGYPAPRVLTRRKKKKKKRRKPVPKAQRARIYERDNWTCVSCGFDGREDPERLTIDHRHPVVHGGTNNDSNLQTMCFPCNNAKADSIPED